MPPKLTEDGLPVVTEEIFMEFIRSYPISFAENDPGVTERIKLENPQIYRILYLGMKSAPTRESRVYFECGVQIAYEMLRRQSKADQE